MRAGFVVPRPTSPSGGHAYNQAVLRAWPGEPPEVIELDGPWPHGDRASLDELRQALGWRRVVLVDGLVGAAHPDLLVQAAEAGVKVVLLVHLPLSDEGGLSADEATELAVLERRSVRAAWRVVTTSHWAAAEVSARYGRADLIAVPPGVEAAPLGEPTEPPHLISVGALSPRKNQLALLTALQACADLDWRLTLAGPITDPGYARRILDNLPTRGGWAGTLTGARLDALYADASLLVHPATAETWGMVVTEALARGVPAIVGAGTGAAEALASGGTSVLPGATVDPSDPTALAGMLRRFLTDPATRDGWRQAALAGRRRLRGWEQAAAELASLLEQAASEPDDPSLGRSDGRAHDHRPGAAALPAGAIDPGWLALRRPVDAAAREAAAGLVALVRADLEGAAAAPRVLGDDGPPRGSLTVIDVGAGTGANQAWLAPRLGPAEWILLDHDPRLLADAAHQGRRVLGGLDELPALIAGAGRPCLVTCSALLDLLSSDDLVGLAGVLASERVPALLSLSVDGTTAFDPPDPDDALVAEAFNDHQRRDRRPGPDAARSFAELCRERGLKVDQVATPWLVDGREPRLLVRYLAERGEAAAQQRPDVADRIRTWVQCRQEQAAAGSLRATVGHLDLLVRPVR